MEWGEFSNFINGVGFIDPPYKGKKFSWFGGDGSCKSRLEKFRVTHSIVDRWGVVGQFIGRETSLIIVRFGCR